MSFEESLVRHAAPTLAGIKVANLYNFRFRSQEECIDTLREFNAMMNKTGVFIELMQHKDNFYLIYIYRKSQLARLLAGDEVRQFLKDYGYPVDGGLSACLSFLKKKINEEKVFPHEIGVFLEYPLADVRGFIDRKGQDNIACGEWKVYQDEEAATRTFYRHRRCKDVYLKVYMQGRQFSRMLVTA